LIDERIVNRNFYFCLRHEFYDIFGATINLRVAALPAEAANLGDGDTLHPHVAHGLPNIVELEWLDNRCNELHRMTFLAQSLAVAAGVPGSGSEVSIGCATREESNAISGLALCARIPERSLHRMRALLE